MPNLNLIREFLEKRRAEKARAEAIHDAELAFHLLPEANALGAADALCTGDGDPLIQLMNDYVSPIDTSIPLAPPVPRNTTHVFLNALRKNCCHTLCKTDDGTADTAMLGNCGGFALIGMGLASLSLLTKMGGVLLACTWGYDAYETCVRAGNARHNAATANQADLATYHSTIEQRLSEQALSRPLEEASAGSEDEKEDTPLTQSMTP